MGALLWALWALPFGAALADQPSAVAPRLGAHVEPMRVQRLAQLDLATLAPAWPRAVTLEANSEQRQPLHLGESPREQILRGKTAAIPRIPAPLRPLAVHQALDVVSRLGRNAVATELEVWPVQNDVGRLTWVFSRYRDVPAGGVADGASSPWTWLRDDLYSDAERNVDDNLVRFPRPTLPSWYNPASTSDFRALYQDFLAADSLYDKPLFSECIWTTRDGAVALSAWRPSGDLAAERTRVAALPRAEQGAMRCAVLPQPARVNLRPVTFHLRVRGGAVQFVDIVDASWVEVPAATPLRPALAAALATVRLPTFPAKFDDDYRRDVALLTGQTALPGGLLLRRKNSADPQHQLEALVDYLQARYTALGLRTQRQQFLWRGIQQSNLIAILPASPSAPSTPSATAATENRPIALADHIDTAFSQDVYDAKHRERDPLARRVSAPGADDNVTATATLLRAAEVLRALPRKHDIWILHLTGEEFPADDLGARQHVAQLLNDRRDLGALLLLDMTGYNPQHRREFQLNPGGLAAAGHDAMQIAALSALLSPRVAPRLVPVVRPPTDLHSYLYNTDGLIYAEHGFPVLFFNEVMNRYRLGRQGYHDSHDTLANIDVPYAAGIARVAIATAAALSQTGLP